MALERPNIIVVLSDQQRWDTVECYGRPIFPGLTPNIDRMAREGVLFEHAFTPQPVCGPARSCLQTGRWATETGCFRNGIALPIDTATVGALIRQAGYQVGYIGKWHLASTPEQGINFETRPVPPERRGGYEDFWVASDILEFTSHSYDGHLFDEEGRKVEFPNGRYRADFITDIALEKLRSRDPEKPLFMFISYVEPHHQNDHGHFEGPIGSKKRFASYNVPGDLEGRAGDWAWELPDYLGAVNSLDSNVGRIRAELDDLGMGDETVVIYTSDHGCHFRTRNAEYKRSCHESSIRVPLVAIGPGLEGGTRIKQLVSLIDLPPTFLELSGVEVPRFMRGKSLLPLVTGQAEGWRPEVFVQISESQVGRSVRTQRWKYSVRSPTGDGYRDISSDIYVEEYLYDLQEDPYERRNLVSDPSYEDVRAYLSERLKTRIVQAGEKRPLIKPAPTCTRSGP